jgi:glyoxylase-like metal-dependent hydrolase (beta-lactamase superfamily II)
LEKVRVLPGVDPELLMVPTPGHSRGHAAVAVSTDAGWLVHCGDAYFHRDEMDPKTPHCPAGLRFFQNRVEVDKAARIGNQARLRELGKDKDVTLFSAHDAVEFRRLSGG